MYRTTSMGDVLKYYRAGKAAGKKFQPWEIESAYKAELATGSEQRYKNRVLELSAEELAEKKRMDDEAIRMNKENIAQADKTRESAEEAGKKGVIAQGVTTAALIGAMSDPDKPGIISKGKDLVKSGYEKLTGKPSTPKPAPETAPVTQPPVDYAVPAPEPGYQLNPSGNYPADTPLPSGIETMETGVGDEAALEAADLAGLEAGEKATSSVAGGTASTLSPYFSSAGSFAAGAGYRELARGGMQLQRKAFGEQSEVGKANKIGYETTDWRKMPQGVGYPIVQEILGQDEADKVAPIFYGSNPLLAPVETYHDNTPKERVADIVTAGGYSSIKETVKKLCLIITACTDIDSYEVNISRKYRDRYMDNMELRGYYIIAEFIVPKMKRPWLKRFIKRVLVDSIVDYSEYAVGVKKELPKLLSTIVMKAFLGLCAIVGSRRRTFVRCNGEIF